MTLDELKSQCVEIGDCWVWQGPTCASGRYGRVNGYRPMKMAHRLAYEISKGPIEKGLVICHTCDNGLCINPSHLFKGTVRDNALDAVAKGRIPKMVRGQGGEANLNAKLTFAKAKEIRDYHRMFGGSYPKLAARFGLKSAGHAHAIATGKLWREGGRSDNG